MERLVVKETEVVHDIPFGDIDGVIAFLLKLKAEKENKCYRNVQFYYKWTGYEDFDFISSHERDENDEEVADRLRDARMDKKRAGIKAAHDARIANDVRLKRIAELRAEIDSLA